MFFYQGLIKFQYWRLPQILSKPFQCILPSRLVSESKGKNNIERPSRTSCPDGYNFWHLEPCRLSCWLWGADSLYFGCGFVSVVGEGIASAVCLLQLSLLSMLGSSKVQRKVVYYYCMWVAEGQTHSLDFDAWFSSLWVSSCILKAQFGADQTVSEQMQLEWG